MPPYSEHLIFADTADQLALDGVLIRPTKGKAKTAVLWVHGNTSQFHSFPYVLIGRALAERGLPFLSGNTRGAEVTASIFSLKEFKFVAGGSAWECYEDSPHDLAAWIDHLAKVGIANVILAGHSLGAAKVVYYAAQRADPRVKGVVLASPDLKGHWSQLVEPARQMVAEGRGDDLLPPLFNSAWYRLTAHNVISRAEVLTPIYQNGQSEPGIAAVHVSILAFFGDAGDVGGQRELEILSENAKNAPDVKTHLLAGADHAYTDHEAAAATLIADWIRERGL